MSQMAVNEKNYIFLVGIVEYEIIIRVKEKDDSWGKHLHH